MDANLFWLTDEQFAKVEPVLSRDTRARSGSMIAASSAASSLS